MRKTLLSMLAPLSPDLGEGRLPTMVQCGEFSVRTSVEEEAWPDSVRPPLTRIVCKHKLSSELK